MKKYFKAIVALFFILSNISSFAQENNLYSPDKKISLLGDGGYDYLFIDQQSRKLYVSHGTSVQVIDLKTETLIGSVENMQGNHGVAVDPGTRKGFISDGKANTVVVFDLANLKTITTIPLTGKKPDAIMFDRFSRQVFAFNSGSDNVSVIDVNSLKEIKKIELGGGPEFAVSNGHGKIYNNLEDKNMLKVIDSKTLTVIDAFPLSPCGGPTGLAMDSAGQRLFTVCRENKGMSVLDMNTGKVITTIPIGAGVDAVAYDAATKLIFCSNADGTTTIIKQQDADTYAVVQTLATQLRAKTLALDNQTHKIYLSAADFEPGTKNIIPGSFKVLVYKMNQ